MTAATYASALKNVLIHEGGFINHPADPGGATNRGVTQRVYDGFRTRKGLARRSVKLIQDVEVNEIYKIQYWDKVRGNELPRGIDYTLFDGAVNSGPVQSIKWLQRALGVQVDGMLGAATIAAVDAILDHDALIAKILAARLAFLKALKTFKTFGKGWTSRVTQVQKISQAWAVGSVAPAAVYAMGMGTKAVIEDAKELPSHMVGVMSTGGGLGMAGMVNEAKDTILPYTDTPFVQKMFVALTVAGLALAVFGMAYGFWAKMKEAKRIKTLDLLPPPAAEAVAYPVPIEDPVEEPVGEPTR